jgi:hypothetical protein
VARGRFTQAHGGGGGGTITVEALGWEKHIDADDAIDVVSLDTYVRRSPPGLMLCLLAPAVIVARIVISVVPRAMQEDGVELAVLGCEHHGEWEAMQEWLQTKGSCPVCRSTDLVLATARQRGGGGGGEGGGEGGGAAQPPQEEGTGFQETAVGAAVGEGGAENAGHVAGGAVVADDLVGG